VRKSALPDLNGGQVSTASLLKHLLYVSMAEHTIEINAAEAVEKYLKHHKKEHSSRTHSSHRYRLNHFVRWCETEQQHMESLSELRPHHFQDYRYWRQEDGDLNQVSLKTQLGTLRVFTKWAEDYGAVERGLHKHIRVPTPDDNTRDTKLESRANLILNYLSKFEYASYRHTLFAFLWHTSMRIGSARAIDLKDFHPSENYVEIRHRPEQDTPLKNKRKGERPVYLDDKHTTLLQDYIKARRHDVTDDYGRKPLFTSTHGRPVVSTHRDNIYSLSRPCKYDDGHCPHGRDMEDCEAAQSMKDASKCPSSISPHTIRRGSITHWLKQDEDGTNKSAISKRVNSTEDVIEKHYDKRSELEKMQQRKDLFSDG